MTQLKAFSGLNRHSSCAPPFTRLPFLSSQSPHQAPELQLLSYLWEPVCWFSIPLLSASTMLSTGRSESQSKLNQKGCLVKNKL